MRRSSRSFSAYDQFAALCFGQLTGRQSLRDIVACLNSRPQLLYHLGIRGGVSRTNLAYANEHRDWHLFAAVAEVLIQKAQRLYASEKSDPDFPEVALALDASIIHLSLKIFPWAYWGRSRAGALKLHTLVTLQGSLPVWAAITEAAFPEVKMLSEIPVQPGAYYVMDRAYWDFRRLLRLQSGGAKFVVRNKRNVAYRPARSSRVDKSTGLRCDQVITLTSPRTRRAFPCPLRRIKFRDAAEGRTLIFLTNDLDLPALTICQLYKRRWEVELFFKWIKQHLRLRHFFGRTLNAVHCQVWTALCSYLLVAIARKEVRTERSLYEMLQIVGVSAFEQMPLAELVAKTTVKPINVEMQMSLLLNDF